MMEEQKRELAEKIDSLQEEYKQELKAKKQLEKQYKKLDKRSANELQRELMRTTRRISKLKNSIEAYENVLNCLNKELDFFAVNKIFLTCDLYGMPEIIRFKMEQKTKDNQLKAKIMSFVHNVVFFGVIGALVGLLNVNIIPITASIGALVGAGIGFVTRHGFEETKPLRNEEKLAIIKEVDKERGLKDIFEKQLKKKKAKLSGAEKKMKKLSKSLSKINKRFEKKESFEEELVFKQDHLDFLSSQKSEYEKEYNNLLEAEKLFMGVMDRISEDDNSEKGYSYVKKDKVI